MAWQDMAPFPTPRMDAEEERELRLAAQARAGAEWALAALIARYQPPVLRYLTRLTGNPQQSHLLAERIFVRMERRLRGPHGAEFLRLWLLRASTEAGLDTLRHPRRSRQQSRLNAPSGPRGLLADGLTVGATDRLRAGLGKIAAITGSTRRQARQLIWNSDAPATPGDTAQSQAAPGSAADASPGVDPALDTMNPQEELRHRLIRAVLAELPYGDAQCLALHLVAGLNQTEVARALGIRPSAARHRIVQGLQMFAHRYDAAITSLGVPSEVAYAEDTASLLTTPAAETSETPTALDVTHHPGRDIPYGASQSAPSAPGEGYPESGAGSSLPHVEIPPYMPAMPTMPDDPGGDLASNSASGGAYGATMVAEPAPLGEAFPEGYGSEYDAGYDAGYDPVDVLSAPVYVAPVVESHTPPSVIVDALPNAAPATTTDQPAEHAAATEVAAVADELDSQPDAYWLEQPTMVPILSIETGNPSEAALADEANEADKAARPAEPPPFVPVLTPPGNQ